MQGVVFGHPATMAVVEARRERMKQALLVAGVDEHRIAKRISVLLDSDNETASLGAIDRACRLLGLQDDDDSARRVVTVLIGQFNAVVQTHAPAALASRILRALADTGQTNPQNVRQLPANREEPRPSPSTEAGEA